MGPDLGHNQNLTTSIFMYLWTFPLWIFKWTFIESLEYLAGEMNKEYVALDLE